MTAGFYERPGKQSVRPDACGAGPRWPWRSAGGGRKKRNRTCSRSNAMPSNATICHAAEDQQLTAPDPCFQKAKHMLMQSEARSLVEATVVVRCNTNNSESWASARKGSAIRDTMHISQIDLSLSLQRLAECLQKGNLYFVKRIRRQRRSHRSSWILSAFLHQAPH